MYTACAWLLDDISVTLKKCYIGETGTASAIDEKIRGKEWVIDMDEMTSRDDEKAREQAAEKERKVEQDRQQDDLKAREQATEKGRKEEQDLQKERDLATEKGRKQGVSEERAREKQKGGRGSGLTILLALVVLVIIVVVAAFLTLSVSVTNVSPGTSLPFTTNYGVSFPEGQTITIGNTHINVLYVPERVNL